MDRLVRIAGKALVRMLLRRTLATGAGAGLGAFAPFFGGGSVSLAVSESTSMVSLAVVARREVAKGLDQVWPMKPLRCL